MVFHLANFIDLTNVSVQLILFPLNLVLRASLPFSGTESIRSTRTMLILLILTLYGTFDISLQWWLLIPLKFFRIFPIEILHPADKIWLALIICLATIISYYHLLSLHEKNQDYYPLAASQWLCKDICKSSIRSLGPLSLFQVICWNTVWLYMLSCQSMPSSSLLVVFQIFLNMTNSY